MRLAVLCPARRRGVAFSRIRLSGQEIAGIPACVVCQRGGRIGRGSPGRPLLQEVVLGDQAPNSVAATLRGTRGSVVWVLAVVSVAMQAGCRRLKKRLRSAVRFADGRRSRAPKLALGMGLWHSGDVSNGSNMKWPPRRRARAARA